MGESLSGRLPLPSVSAVLLADHIIVEASTNKKSLVGLYSNIFARNVPVKRHLNIFVEISDAQGTYDFDLEVAHLESEKVVARGRMPGIVARDRLNSLELVVHMPVRFTAFGTYEFRMNYRKNVFAARTFRVMAAPAPKHAHRSGPDEKI